MRVAGVLSLFSLIVSKPQIVRTILPAWKLVELPKPAVSKIVLLLLLA
jgi:hypothetical protein